MSYQWKYTITLPSFCQVLYRRGIVHLVYTCPIYLSNLLLSYKSDTGSYNQLSYHTYTSTNRRILRGKVQSGLGYALLLWPYKSYSFLTNSSYPSLPFLLHVLYEVVYDPKVVVFPYIILFVGARYQIRTDECLLCRQMPSAAWRIGLAVPRRIELRLFP